MNLYWFSRHLVCLSQLYWVDFLFFFIGVCDGCFVYSYIGKGSQNVSFLSYLIRMVEVFPNFLRVLPDTVLFSVRKIWSEMD